jgi:hypothetical protein
VTAGLVKANGDGISASGNILAFENIRIPINGWENSNIIVGSFNGLQSCTDTLACTDTFSAKITGGGIVSGENVDWISGNASLTDTSLYAISFNTGIFTTAPNCTLTEVDSITTLTTSVKNSTEPTLSGVSVRTGFNTVASSFTKAVVPFHIICQKQGADYIGKTAMAVASDQNVRSFATNAVLYSANLNFNCAILGQTGAWLTLASGTGSGTGCSYTVNSGRVLSKMVCTTTSATSNNCSNATGLSVSGFGIRNKTCDTNANSDDGVYIMCHGEQ